MRAKYENAQHSGVIPNWMEAAGRSFTNTMLNAAGEIPDLAVTAPAAIANQFVKANTLGAVDMKEQMASQGVNIPDVGQQVFPSFIGEDSAMPYAIAQKAGDMAGYIGDVATNGLENAGMMPDPTAPAGAARMIPHSVPISDAIQQQERRGELLRKNHPNASLFGDALGLGATMQLGRNLTGYAKNSAIKSAKLDASLARHKGVDKFFSEAETRREAVDVIKNQAWFQRLAGKSGRSVEAGVEGYVAGLLNDGDPIDTAAFAAGAQTAGTVALSGLSGVFKDGLGNAGRNIAVLAVGAGALSQMLNGAMPGDQNFVLDGIDSGFTKVMAGIGIGMTAAAMGYGRAGKDAGVKLAGEVIDAMTAVPRTTVLGLVTEMQTDPDVNAVVRQLGKGDPDFFTSDEIRVLGRAQISKEPDSMAKAIEYLSKKQGFREKLEKLR